MPTKTYDKKCYDLASQFLDDSTAFTRLPVVAASQYASGLASAVPSTIEDFLDENGFSEDRGSALPPASKPLTSVKAVIDGRCNRPPHLQQFRSGQ